MAADALYLLDVRLHINSLAEQLHLFLALDDASSESSHRLVTGKQNGAFRSPEIMLQMMADTAGVAHACS